MNFYKLRIIAAPHFHEQCCAVTAVRFSIFHGKTQRLKGT